MRQLMQSNKVLELFRPGILSAKNSLVDSIGRFKMNDLLVDLPQDLFNEALKSSIEQKIYLSPTVPPIDSQKIADISFLGGFPVLLEDFEKNLGEIVKVTANKMPPFGFSQETIDKEFVTPSLARLSFLRNAIGESLGNHNSTLSKIKELVTTTEPRKSATRLLVVKVCFALLFLAFLAGAFSISFYINQKLLDLLLQYNHLRREEIESERSILQHRSAFLKKYHLNEPAMMSNFIENQSVLTILNPAAETKQSKTGEASRKPYQNRRGRHNLNLKLTFSSALVLRIASLFSLTLPSLFYVGMALNDSAFAAQENQIAFYTKSFEEISNSFHNYLCHSLYLAFGNFVTVGGKQMSTIIGAMRDPTPEDHLIQLLIGQKRHLRSFFGQDRGAAIDNLLFKDLCSHIPTIDIEYTTMMLLCTTNPHASKGFLAFLQYQKESHLKIRTTVNLDQTFLEKSKTDWLGFAFDEFTYQQDMLSFKRTIRVVYKTVYYQILRTGDESILTKLEKLKEQIFYLNRFLPSLLLPIYIIAFFCFVFTKIRHDSYRCAESLFNIIPDIIAQNKIINKKFRELYSVEN